MTPRAERDRAVAAAQADADAVEALGRAAPSSAVPSQDSRSGSSGVAGTAVASRFTSVPRSSTIETVTSSSRRIRSRIRATSRRPSSLGEKCWEMLRRFATVGALLSRCATKKAAKVATTSRTKTARAGRLTVDGSGRLVGPGEHDDVRARAPRAAVSESSASAWSIDSSSAIARAELR